MRTVRPLRAAFLMATLAVMCACTPKVFVLASKTGATSNSLSSSLTPSGPQVFSENIQVDSSAGFSPYVSSYENRRLSSLRSFHTETVLLNGQILVTGGRSGYFGSTIKTTELYDPTLNSWRIATPLSEPREQHTATLLPSGKVLVVGGVYYGNGLPPVTSAELYHPDTDHWTLASPPSIALDLHTATRLSSGQVLVINGTSGEIYDPDSNTWSLTSPLNVYRHFHTASALPSGKVLVTGGGGGGGRSGAYSIADCELYDPVADTWTMTAPMQTPRGVHAASVLLSGKVIVTGGQRYYFDGIYNAHEYPPTTEIYDPDTDTWSFGAPLSGSRYDHTSNVLPSGKVLVVGGWEKFKAEIYDPATNTWADAGFMGGQRVYHTSSALPSGKVIVAGGSEDTMTVIYDSNTNIWDEGAELSGRQGHTSSLLPSGKILITGGSTAGNGFPLRTEIYDPIAKTWKSGARLNVPRTAHSATVLFSGKVLVVGGYSYNTYLDSAELYDPVADTWSLIAPMHSARNSHTATLLPDGKVMITAGIVSHWWSFTTAVEIYDPATNAWTSAAPVIDYRKNHTATALSSGKVLISGGFFYDPDFGDMALNSAELYDPVSDTWTRAANLNNGEGLPSSILLPSGEVLCVGSNSEIYTPTTDTWRSVGLMSHALVRSTITLLSNGTVLYVWKHSDGTSSRIFDPVTELWTSPENLPQTHNFHTATPLLDGNVLIVGRSTNGFDAITDIYDSTQNLWLPTEAVVRSITPRHRQTHTATVLPNGKVLVIGGWDGNDIQVERSAEIFDPAASSWFAVKGLQRGPREHKATLLQNGKVLITGGIDTNGYSANTDLYDPNTDSWSPQAPLAAAVSYHTVTLLESGHVLVIGGSDPNSQPTTHVQIFNPGSNSWSVLASMNVPRMYHTTTLLRDGRILVAGGFDAAWAPLSDTELYDPVSDIWTPAPMMNEPRSGWFTATLLQNGKVLVAGGYVDSDWTPSATAELFDPNTNTWSSGGTLNHRRGDQTASLLPSGKVLLAGGSDLDGTTWVDVELAEVYDPNLNLWAPAGSLRTTRGYYFTASVLQDGRVLIHGGGRNNAGNYITTPEFFSMHGDSGFVSVIPTCGNGPYLFELLSGGGTLYPDIFTYVPGEVFTGAQIKATCDGGSQTIFTLSP